MLARFPIRQMVMMMAGVAQLCGCSGAQFLDLIVPDKGYTVHKDIAYAPGERQMLDVYVPEKPDPSGKVIIFYYGGSWQDGSRDIYRFVGQAFASRGYVTVVADYRLYPQVYYPAFVEDGAKALAWVHKHIHNYGGNNRRIFVSGHSAGAYIAVMLALNTDFIEQAGGDASWIKGAIGIAGPYDFLPFTDPNIKDIFSKADALSTQPVTYIRPDAPPILLLSGDVDEDVAVGNAQSLATKLERIGAPVRMYIYPDVTHIGIILALAHGFEKRAPTLEDITAFIHDYGN